VEEEGVKKKKGKDYLPTGPLPPHYHNRLGGKVRKKKKEKEREGIMGGKGKEGGGGRGRIEQTPATLRFEISFFPVRIEPLSDEKEGGGILEG